MASPSQGTASIFDIPLQVRRAALILLVTLAATIMATSTGHAQTLTVLHNFDLGTDGGSPFAGVTLDQAGNIYGTTSDGGTYRQGVVYRLVHSGTGWILRPIYTFQGKADGGVPYARVLFGPDSTLYGTTNGGGAAGYGTVFNLRPPASACKAALCPWTETGLYSFTNGSDGGYPYLGDLIFDQAGNIYGTGGGGGAYGYGVVFKLTRSGGGWTESVLWSFTGGNDGATPYSGVIFDGAGNLYGTARYGPKGNGTVYELSPSQSGWTEKTLYIFTDQDGGNAIGGVTMDAHGNLYGTTGGGGGPGEAYELSPSNGNWVFTLLQAFSGYEGPYDTPTLDSQGNVYGTSSLTGGYGEVFKLTPSDGGWIYTHFHDFYGGDGEGPVGGVTFDANGNLYGTTDGGGKSTWGVVWEITP